MSEPVLYGYLVQSYDEEGELAGEVIMSQKIGVEREAAGEIRQGNSVRISVLTQASPSGALKTMADVEEWCK